MTRHKSYILFFGASPVADVTEEDCDLLSIMGAYKLREAARANPALRAVIAWHDDCVARAELRSKGRSDDLGIERDARFQDLLETSCWALVGSEGDRHPIARPRFLTRGKIVWGWAE